MAYLYKTFTQDKVKFAVQGKKKEDEMNSEVKMWSQVKHTELER